MAKSRTPFFRSLSFQLLVLTILFVVLVSVIIYIPSMAAFWKNYLDQRLVAAQIAALSLEETPGQEVSPELEAELLTSAEIQAVIVIREDSRQLILRSTLPAGINAFYDMRSAGNLDIIGYAFETLSRRGEANIQVQGSPINTRHQSIQIVLDEGPLYQAVSQYSKDFIRVSFLVSGAGAVLIYLIVLFTLVRPTTRISENLTAFSKSPLAEDSTIKPGRRKDEVGALEHEILGMQMEIQKALRERSRLANLGLAVSKINHDLKNILSTARLSLDLLENKATDERQGRIMDRFLRSVDRAVALGERTLKYGRAGETPPEKTRFVLNDLVKGVESTFREGGYAKLKLENAIQKDIEILADREQIFRLLFNLTRNALEAMDGMGKISLTAEVKGARILIRFSDTGPGIPAKMLENLFVPFASSSKGGGSGLGLVIARELAELNAGGLELEKTGPKGTTFLITLPKA